MQFYVKIVNRFHNCWGFWRCQFTTAFLNCIIAFSLRMYNSMRKGFMYIDEIISIDFDMSEELHEYIDGMNKAFEGSAEDACDYYHEVIGEFAKNTCSECLITTDQMYKIWERYGTAG